MRKTLIIVIMMLVALSIYGYTYAQIGRGPNITSSTLSNFNTYLNMVEQDKGGVTLISSPYLRRMETEGYYSDSPANKIGIGAMNAATSWVDIPKRMTEVSDRYNLFAGFTFGFGEGLVYSLNRGVSGVLDMATFGLPPYDEPTIKPEYKVDKPQNGFKVKILEW